MADQKLTAVDHLSARLEIILLQNGFLTRARLIEIDERPCFPKLEAKTIGKSVLQRAHNPIVATACHLLQVMENLI